MSVGFDLPFRPASQTKDFIRFSAGNDGEMEDESLEPPLVRVRDVCQNNTFLDCNQFNQKNSFLNTAQWQPGSLGPEYTINSSGQTIKLGKPLFSPKIKRFTPTFVQYGYYTANVNNRNNTIKFRKQANYGVEYTATIPPYNYMKVCSPGNPAILSTLANCNAPPSSSPQLDSAFPNGGNRNEGIIPWVLFALNTALGDDGNIYDPVAQGQWTFQFTNGYLYQGGYRTLSPYPDPVLYDTTSRFGYFVNKTASPIVSQPFAFTGGSIFTYGLTVLGLKPIPRANIMFNPVTPDLSIFVNSFVIGSMDLVYSRFFDVCSQQLTQYSKMTNAGTGAPAVSLMRIYPGDDIGNGIRGIVLDGFRQQSINMRKDFTMGDIDIFILDEYGQLIDVPDTQNNTFWISIILNGQL